MRWPVRRLALLPPPAAASGVPPNLDCASAESSDEKLVCADPALAALDRELARLVAPARDCRQASALRECLLSAYLRRIQQLTGDDPGTEETGVTLGPFTVTCEALRRASA